MNPRAADRRPYDLVKRAIDLVVSVVALVLLSPVIAAVAIAVAGHLGRPILYTQERPGRGGVPFRLVKFRSMPEGDTTRGTLSDEQRLTGFGRTLRASSLDELPELWNVVRGEMSLVGPRPLLMDYLERYTRRQARRHEIRPGITGLAQVSGRNALEWHDRLELDVQYVETRSFALDAQILLRTVVAVARREGTSAEGHATMPEFTGEPGAGA